MLRPPPPAHRGSNVSLNQIRKFKITGSELLVPTCPRDVIEQLGIFLTDVELAAKFWEAVARDLQRWAMPPSLAEILRRCSRNVVIWYRRLLIHVFTSAPTL